MFEIMKVFNLTAKVAPASSFLTVSPLLSRGPSLALAMMSLASLVPSLSVHTAYAQVPKASSFPSLNVAKNGGIFSSAFSGFNDLGNLTSAKDSNMEKYSIHFSFNFPSTSMSHGNPLLG